MNNTTTELYEIFKSQINKVSSNQDLENVRLEFMGKKGKIQELMRIMPTLSVEEKKTFGAEVNELKNKCEKELTDFAVKLEQIALEKEIANTEKFDFSLPEEESKGSLHPITLVQLEIEEIFKQMGFVIEDGHEVETEFNNFEAVNIPKDHPARDMQDTFYLNNGQLLKTHTSASQNRIMRKYGAPLRVLFPGRCFRNESVDSSHDNTFFQMEGMMIGEDISISNLTYFMKTLLSEIFKTDVQVRLRPGFFPFVEPGFELDMSCHICGGKGCSTCKNSGWIELVPCGMIHPRVLELGGIDTTKYKGFAFGLGLTRLAMMKYKVPNIRILNSGNLKALSQFKTKLY